MHLIHLFATLAFFATLGWAKESCTQAEIAEGNVHRLSDAINDLALKLYGQFSKADPKANVFFSPLSISTALGMLFYGAAGNTAQEMRTVLGYENAELSDGMVHETFHRFLQETIKDDPSSPYVLDSANAILVEKRLELVPGYKEAVQALYMATVRDVDFLKEAPKVVQEVNAWVHDHTHGKIDKLLDELSPTTVMVLLNAVYFKGTWLTEFQPEKTRMQVFYNHGKDSEAKEVPMMHMTAMVYYSPAEDFQILELPYKGDNVSMFVILPDKRDGLEEFERSLTPEKLTMLFHSTYETKVIISLPKFKMEYSRELSKDLQALGAQSMFGASDFSKMTPAQGVSVSQVIHKAVVEVNEEGSEAAAVTGVIMTKMAQIGGRETPEFQADHPFLFFIRERNSGVILFMGRVENL